MAKEGKRKAEAERVKELDTAKGGIAGQHLRAFVDRLERLDDEIAGLRDDRKLVTDEAESAGFDKRAIAGLLKRRRWQRRSATDLAEQEMLVELYERAVGVPVAAAAGDDAGMVH